MGAGAGAEAQVVALFQTIPRRGSASGLTSMDLSLWGTCVPASGAARVATSAGGPKGSPLVLSDEFIQQLLKWLPPAYGVLTINLQELGHSDR